MKTTVSQADQMKQPSDISTVGEYVHYVREAKGLTLRSVVELVAKAIKQKQLDPQSAVSRGYLSSLESGRYSNPSPFKLKAIAYACNVSYELLLNKAGYWDKTSQKVKNDAAFTLMLKEVQDMTAGERKSVLEYIEFVKSRRKQIYDKSPKKG
jgi:transcriptional regulator with XRE-family HTH domain